MSYNLFIFTRSRWHRRKRSPKKLSGQSLASGMAIRDGKISWNAKRTLSRSSLRCCISCSFARRKPIMMVEHIALYVCLLTPRRRRTRLSLPCGMVATLVDLNVGGSQIGQKRLEVVIGSLYWMIREFENKECRAARARVAWLSLHVLHVLAAFISSRRHFKDTIHLLLVCPSTSTSITYRNLFYLSLHMKFLSRIPFDGFNCLSR